MKIGPDSEKHRQAAGEPPTRCTKSSTQKSPWWRRFDMLLMGCAALLWLILRSGPKPTRLSYPCQQSAFGLAAGVFGAPVVAAVVHGRDRLMPHRRAVGAVAMLALVAAVAAA